MAEGSVSRTMFWQRLEGAFVMMSPWASSTDAEMEGWGMSSMEAKTSEASFKMTAWTAKCVPSEDSRIRSADASSYLVWNELMLSSTLPMLGR